MGIYKRSSDKMEIRSFCQKYSFLTMGDSPHVKNVESVEKVAVGNIDENLMEKIPQYDGATGSLVGVDNDQNIFILNTDGNILKEVIQDYYCIHNEAHCDNESRDGESVGEALDTVEKIEDVTYVLIIHKGYIVRDHYSEGGFSIELYLESEDFSIAEYLHEKRESSKVW